MEFLRNYNALQVYMVLFFSHFCKYFAALFPYYWFYRQNLKKNLHERKFVRFCCSTRIRPSPPTVSIQRQLALDITLALLPLFRICYWRFILQAFEFAERKCFIESGSSALMLPTGIASMLPWVFRSFASMLPWVFRRYHTCFVSLYLSFVIDVLFCRLSSSPNANTSSKAEALRQHCQQVLHLCCHEFCFPFICIYVAMSFP